VRVAIAAAAIACATVVIAQNDAVNAAMRALGANGLQGVEYSATGTRFAIGQAPAPGEGWPSFRLTRYVADVNYETQAAREELVYVDDANPPVGGGAGPFIAATGQGGIRPIPGDVRQNQLRDGRTEAGLLQMVMTPHGFLKLAAANNASTKVIDARGRKLQTISFSAAGRTFTGTLNDQNLVERVETRLPNPVLGDMPVEVTFSDYRDFSGLKFPAHIVQKQGGHLTLDLIVNSVQPNSPAAMQVTLPPQRAAAAPERVGSEKIGDGLWFLTGGAPLSLLVEFKDYLVVIEAPQNDEHTTGVLEETRRLVPNKPVRYVVNTHLHFDHSGGLRGYVAEGVTVLTHEKNKGYLERILRNPFTLSPDRLASSNRRLSIETVADKRVITDGARSLELYHLKGNLYEYTLLMAYLPKERLLIQADAFHPRPGAAPLPAPSPYTTNLVDNVNRLKLDVDRVVHIHGGIDPYSAVLKAAGRS
jgi:glyoxylase-like metal-dependent hydrolase (beta-lactamase superfamily II)